MSTSSTSLSDVIDLDSDLPSVASQAAIELDNLLLERALELTAVARLAEMIRAVAPPAEHPLQIQHLDIGSTLAVNRAAARFAGAAAPTRLSELLPRVQAFAQRLSDLAGPATERNKVEGDVRELKAFCLELSRQAATGQRCAHDRPSHPYRRLL